MTDSGGATLGANFNATVLGAEESTLLSQEIAAVILLVIAAGVAVVAARLRFPYTVALVIAGFGASALGELVAVDISPDLILALLVPPLLFEATLHLPWAKLKADLTPILLFALLGTFIGTMVLGVLANAVLGLPWAAAFAFGALISATDPVAVIAFFKALGAPKRLSVLVEGESLFNDAVAVVGFGLAIAAASGEDEFTLGGAAGQFLLVSAGGLAVGLVLGYLVSTVFLARVDDPLIETSTTLAVAYGSFLLAEEFGRIFDDSEFHLSGILAVVAAGLMVGNLGFQNTSPSTRLTLEHFWELLTFLVNSMVFLVIGLTISLDSLRGELGAVFLGVLAVLILRAILVYGLAEVAERLQPHRRIPTPYRHVMFWAGLRGAISLALVLTITTDDFSQETVETVQAMTFGVVLFTLLIQGTTITGLMNRLGLSGRAENELTQQRHQARIYMARAGQSEVARLGADGVLFGDLADSLGKVYQREVRHQSSRLRDHFGLHPELEGSMLLQGRREALTAERTALAEILRTGLIETSVAEDLAIELSNRLAVLDLLEERWESDPTPSFEPLEATVATERLAGPVPDGADRGSGVGAERSASGELSEIVYVSWGGTGRAASLRRAMGRAHDTGRGLVYLAILDDSHFGDVDQAMLELAKDELSWLLDAQLELTRQQTGVDEVPVRVLLRTGDVVEEIVSAVDVVQNGSEVLIGAPVPTSGHASVADLINAVSRRIGAPVNLVEP